MNAGQDALRPFFEYLRRFTQAHFPALLGSKKKDEKTLRNSIMESVSGHLLVLTRPFEFDEIVDTDLDEEDTEDSTNHAKATHATNADGGDDVGEDEVEHEVVSSGVAPVFMPNDNATLAQGNFDPDMFLDQAYHS